MASEFDNEIDFLLRKAGQQSDFAPNFAAEMAHLDADDLSAFAENALPQSARPALVSHLADCNSCRQILSNLILLNETASEETATITESEKNLIAVKPYWLNSFKKIFAFPTLGYATAALAVLLVGSFAFVALRGIDESRSASVAKIEPEQNATQAKKTPAVRAPATAKDEENEPKQEEQAPADTLNSNTEALVESNTPTLAENEAKSLPPSLRATLGNSRNTAAASNLAAAPRNEVSATNSSNQNSLNITSATERQLPAPVPGAINQPATSVAETVARPAAPKPEDRAKTEYRDLAKDKEAEMDDDKSDLAGSAPSRAKRREAAASVSSDDLNRKVVVETRAVGSKTFQKVGGVWFDSTYSSQNATNIKRNSNEYKKLDSGLRSIAESLSGEIIIVWQGKAYRIR